MTRSENGGEGYFKRVITAFSHSVTKRMSLRPAWSLRRLVAGVGEPSDVNRAFDAARRSRTCPRGRRRGPQSPRAAPSAALRLRGVEGREEEQERAGYRGHPHSRAPCRGPPSSRSRGGPSSPKTASTTYGLHLSTFANALKSSRLIIGRASPRRSQRGARQLEGMRGRVADEAVGPSRAWLPAGALRLF